MNFAQAQFLISASLISRASQIRSTESPENGLFPKSSFRRATTRLPVEASRHTTGFFAPWHSIHDRLAISGYPHALSRSDDLQPLLKGWDQLQSEFLHSRSDSCITKLRLSFVPSLSVAKPFRTGTQTSNRRQVFHRKHINHQLPFRPGPCSVPVAVGSLRDFLSPPGKETPAPPTIRRDVGPTLWRLHQEF